MKFVIPLLIVACVVGVGQEDNVEHSSASIRYTIETRFQERGHSVEKTLGEFEDSDLGLLWTSLGVTDEQWSEWHTSVYTQNPSTLIPDLPLISLLASTDEGLLTFHAREIGELKDELDRVEPRMDNPASRKFLHKLQLSCLFVQQVKGVLLIHPSW